MVPRGSNGAGQAILDAQTLSAELVAHKDPVTALMAYETKRLESTGKIVRTNRTAPPDAILREVYERTGDKPFDDIDKVISKKELTDISDGYKCVAGYDRESLLDERRHRC
jgi:2-polyprenyl-6-methoxyphenol hydroxylase-like FAD-dependent oxidoreductase